MNFFPKAFRGRFDPKHGYKMANKSSQKWVQGSLAFTSRGRYLHTNRTLGERLLQVLTLFKGARFIPCLILGEWWWGLGHFWNRRECLGYSPVSDTQTKKALYHTRIYVEAHEKYRRHRKLLSERITTCHISDQIKDRWRPTNRHHNQHTAQPSSWHFHHKTKIVHSQPTFVTPPCSTQASHPAKNNLQPLTFWPLSGGRRAPVFFLVYRLLLI